MTDGYVDLLRSLDEGGVAYRLIPHGPEGRTDIVSEMRGHPVELAAKCIIVMVKLGKKVTDYVLAVVPGNKLVDLDAIKTLLHGSYVSFANKEIAESLAGTQSGTILPFARNEKLQLIVDPSVLANEKMYFNAARLDMSLEISTNDYRKLALPRVELITKMPASASFV